MKKAVVKREMMMMMLVIKQRAENMTVGQKAMITVMRHKSINQMMVMRQKATVLIRAMKIVRIPMMMAFMMAERLKTLQ